MLKMQVLSDRFCKQILKYVTLNTPNYHINFNVR